MMLVSEILSVGALERSFKTKFIDSWSVGIGLTWVLIDRVNPKPNPTHSARESEWTKVWVVLILLAC
ncbi:hypothetical protein MTR67_002319 [Solanum verrucosum]|uniref:Uncharacterized protein n=1 Tax=Solanum verrucosum TaxID=315347 RepID=A0AAF0T8N2_SOLVR|nr:hypothetical protein MTR67_002319 [Solanum verrucosum]